MIVFAFFFSKPKDWIIPTLKTLHLFRMNANFMLFVNLGGFPLFCFLSESLSEWRGKTHPSESQLSCPSPLKNTKDQKRCPGRSLHWDASHLIVICLFSLWRWGPAAITHHPGPGLCLIWLGFLDCCQIKLAYMFRFLSEKSKSRLFWRSRVHCSTAWQDCASALVCPLVDVNSQSSCRQRILPQWGMMASFFHDVIWIWDYLSSYFTYIYQQSASGSRGKMFLIYNKVSDFLIKLIWPADSIKCKGLLVNLETVFILLSSPILSLWLYPCFVSSLCSEVHLVDEGDSSLWCIMAPALSAMLGSGAVGSEVAGAAWLAKGELALVGTLTGLTAFLLLSVLLLLCASCQGWVTFFDTS